MSIMSKAENKKSKQKYGRAYKKLSEILFVEDLMGINFETNADEYVPEVGTILPRLGDCKSPDDVSRVLREEFFKWFGATASPDRYHKLAERIWEEVIPELEESA